MLSSNDKFPQHTTPGIYETTVGEYKLHRGPFVLIYWSSDFRDIDFIAEISKSIEKGMYRDTPIFGASIDSVETHRKLIEEVKTIDFPVLSDVSHLLALKLGVLDESGYSGNACFIVDDAANIVASISIKKYAFPHIRKIIDLFNGAL